MESAEENMEKKPVERPPNHQKCGYDDWVRVSDGYGLSQDWSQKSENQQSSDHTEWRSSAASSSQPSTSNQDPSDIQEPAHTSNQHRHFNNFGTMDRLQRKMENLNMDVLEKKKSSENAELRPSSSVSHQTTKKPGWVFATSVEPANDKESENELAWKIQRMERTIHSMNERKQKNEQQLNMDRVEAGGSETGPSSSGFTRIGVVFPKPLTGPCRTPVPYKNTTPCPPPPPPLKNENPVKNTVNLSSNLVRIPNGSLVYQAKVPPIEEIRKALVVPKQLLTPHVDYDEFWGSAASSDQEKKSPECAELQSSSPDALQATKKFELTATSVQLDKEPKNTGSETGPSSSRVSLNGLVKVKKPQHKSIFANFCPTGPCRKPVPYKNTVPECLIEKMENEKEDNEYWKAYHYTNNGKEGPSNSEHQEGLGDSRDPRTPDDLGNSKKPTTSSDPTDQLAKQLQKVQLELEQNAFSQFYRSQEDINVPKATRTVLDALHSFTHQEAIEFAAASWFWTGTLGPKLEAVDLKKVDAKEETAFPTFDDEEGVRAYYRVIFDRTDDYILIACHVNIHAFHRLDLRFVIVNDRTIVKGLDGKSVMGQLYLGDIVAVTELARLQGDQHLYQKNVRKITHNTQCTWQVKTMTVLHREYQDNLQFAFLSNGMGIVKGFDEAMDVRGDKTVVLDKLFIGNAFRPHKIDQFYCQNFERKAKKSLVLMASKFPSYPNPSATIYKFHEDPKTNWHFEIGTKAFATKHDSEMEGEENNDPEETVEICVRMGYSAANAILQGRFDCRSFPLVDAAKNGNILRFKIENHSTHPTLGRWRPNSRINIVGPEGVAFGVIESVIEASGNLHIAARLARGNPISIDFSSDYVVHQREIPENAVLQDGFFKNIDPNCNARRIIETLYGAEPIVLNRDDLRNMEFEFPATPSIPLNECQNEYVSMILAGIPMVLGSSPFGCGKSMTIVTAAFEVHKKIREEGILGNEKQQLLITQSNYASVNLVDIAMKANISTTSQDEDQKTPKIVRYVSEKCWKELYDNARTDLDMPKLMEKVFVDWAKGVFEGTNRIRNLNNKHFLAMLKFVLEHNLLSPEAFSERTSILYKNNHSAEKSKAQEPQKISRKLIDAFFTLFQPDIIMVTADSSLSLLKYGLLNNVVTIQIDEASQLPEYTLLTLLVSFPNACFGLIGDIHQLPPFSAEELTGKLKAYGIGNTMERAVQGTLFPKSVLRYVYRCHPKTTQLLSELFYDSQLVSGVSEDQRNGFMLRAPRTFWPNSEYPMIIVDNQGPANQMGTSWSNRGEVKIVKQIIEFILRQRLALAQDIGVISFYSAQTSMLTEELRRSRVKCGTVDAFQGSEREVIILCCTNERISDFMQLSNRLNVAMSRARQATIVIGSVRGLRVAQYWSTVVQRVEENRNMVDTTIHPFRSSTWY